MNTTKLGPYETKLNDEDGSRLESDPTAETLLTMTRINGGVIINCSESLIWEDAAILLERMFNQFGSEIFGVPEEEYSSLFNTVNETIQ